MVNEEEGCDETEGNVGVDKTSQNNPYQIQGTQDGTADEGILYNIVPLHQKSAKTDESAPGGTADEEEGEEEECECLGEGEVCE